MKNHLITNRDSFVIAKYSKIQGILAILIVVINYLDLFFSSRSESVSKINLNILNQIRFFFIHMLHVNLEEQSYIYILAVIIYLLEVIPVILLLIIRKENLRTIGLQVDNFIESMSLSIIVALLLLILVDITAILTAPHGFGKIRFNAINFSLLFFVRFFSISFGEEVIYRGYAQTRIFGLIKNKYMAVLLVQILFTVSHYIAFGSIANYYIRSEIINGISIFVFGICYALIFLKTKNLWGCIVGHTVYNILAELVRVYFS